MRRERARRRNTKTETPPPEPVSGAKPKGPDNILAPPDPTSPCFPIGELVTDGLLRDFPSAEAGTPWRETCELLTGRSPKRTKVRLVGLFLNFTEDAVRGLASRWLEAREQEIVRTGRPGGEEPTLPGPTPEEVVRLPRTRENIETLLLRIHRHANALAGRDCSPDERRLAAASLCGTVGTLFHLCAAKANLLSDHGMDSFLRRGLQPAIRTLEEGKLTRCVHCGMIFRPKRRTQTRCATCARTPGIRQKDSRKRKRAPKE